jgi:tRNA pseudouridine55 synthase
VQTLTIPPSAAMSSLPQLPSRPALRAKPLPREAVHGVLLLDKPLRLSSNDALIRARRLLNAEKAGHGGTLDPLASGLLPLAFGEATKFADDLLTADKTYIAGMRLGMTTTTGDREGEVVDQQAIAENQYSVEQIEAVLAGFRGPQQQIPPMYSALKKDGQALYEYARRGETVERLARSIIIHELSLQPASVEAFPQSFPALADHPVVHLKITCSKGTYIRVLVEDIGRALGCGAHLASLRRTAVDYLSLDHAITLAELEALPIEARRQRLDPIDSLLRRVPTVRLDDVQMKRLQMGQKLSPRGFIEQFADQPQLQHQLSQAGAELLIAKAYGPEQQLLGTVEIDHQALRPRRLVRSIPD